MTPIQPPPFPPPTCTTHFITGNCGRPAPWRWCRGSTIHWLCDVCMNPHAAELLRLGFEPRRVVEPAQAEAQTEAPEKPRCDYVFLGTSCDRTEEVVTWLYAWDVVKPPRRVQRCHQHPPSGGGWGGGWVKLSGAVAENAALNEALAIIKGLKAELERKDTEIRGLQVTITQRDGELAYNEAHRCADSETASAKLAEMDKKLDRILAISNPFRPEES